MSTIQIAKEASIGYIREKACGLRKYLGFDQRCFIHPLELLDRLSLVSINKSENMSMDYEFISDREGVIPGGSEAYTDSKERKIYIRERIAKELADNRFGRNIFTIFHEVGHLVLHCARKDGISIIDGDPLPDNHPRNPEHQADVFASELAMPYEAVKDMDAQTIMLTYNVTYQAATKRLQNIIAENKKRIQ